MAQLNTPDVPDGHFDGNRHLTRANVSDPDVGDLATILQGVKDDLEEGSLGLAESFQPQKIMVDFAGGATADVDIAIPVGMKVRVLDVKARMRANGTAGDTFQAKKVVPGPTVTDISDAIDLSDAAGDQKLKEASTIDHAQWELDGDNGTGDLLRLSAVDGGGGDAPAFTALVELVRVP